MLKKIAVGITTLVSISIIGACAGNTVSGIRNNSDSDNFGILNTENGKGGGFGKGNFMKGFLKDLNLTADQKTQLEALKKEMHSSADKDKNKGNREAFKNTLKEAFLSTTINKADLKAKLQALKPQDNSRATLMATNLIKAYNILTPEQRTKIETKMNEMESKFQNMSKNPIGKMMQGFKDKRFDWFTSDLNLNDTQKADLKALFNEGQPDRTSMFEKMKTVKNSVIAELKSGNPSADKIASIIKTAREGAESQIDSRLDKFIKLHDTLTADQRQKLVTKVESMMSKMKGHKGKRHHGR